MRSIWRVVLSGGRWFLLWRVDIFFFFFFFFQAEDGIRDLIVTGVQTCALPICWLKGSRKQPSRWRALTTAFLSRCDISRSTSSPTTGHLLWTIFKSTGRQMRTTPTSISFVKVSVEMARPAVVILAGGESRKYVRTQNPSFILTCRARLPNQRTPVFRGCVISAFTREIEFIFGRSMAG